MNYQVKENGKIYTELPFASKKEAKRYIEQDKERINKINAKNNTNQTVEYEIIKEGRGVYEVSDHRDESSEIVIGYSNAVICRDYITQGISKDYASITQTM